MALLDALREKDSRLAVMYEGSLTILQSTNPNRLPLAAHGLRELMDKLPEYADVPVGPKGTTLKERVRELAEYWKPDVFETVAELTNDLRRFVQKAHEFFDWFDDHLPSRKERLSRVLRSLDPLGSPLPEPIAKEHVKEWDQCNGFFQAVSHHGKSPSDEEFEDYLSRIERFLLDQLRPRTFEDHAELDALIAEGEADA